MINVQFPTPGFKIEKRGENQYIFDAIRKRWLLLTEEEWVRQNMVAYFIQTMGYPKEAFALEKEVKVNGLNRRFDILVYNQGHQPWMLVECKAAHIQLSEIVLQQALNYNMALPVTWIVITNGEKTLTWKKEGMHLSLQTVFPRWEMK